MYTEKIWLVGYSMVRLVCIGVLQNTRFYRDCLEISPKDGLNDGIKESENPLYASRWEINQTFHSLYWNETVFKKRDFPHFIFQRWNCEGKWEPHVRKVSTHYLLRPELSDAVALQNLRFLTVDSSEMRSHFLLRQQHVKAYRGP